MLQILMERQDKNVWIKWGINIEFNQIEHFSIQTCLIILMNLKLYSTLTCLSIKPNLNELLSSIVALGALEP